MVRSFGRTARNADRGHAFARCAPACVLAVFLSAGAVKGTPAASAIPVDLTAASAGLLALVVLHRVIEPRSRIPNSVGAIALLWLAFIPGALSSSSTEGGGKVIALFTLTLLAALATPFVLSGEREIAAFCSTLVGIAVLLVGVSILFPDQRALDSGRLSAEGSSTIGVSRAAGAAILVCLVAIVTRRWKPLIGLVLITFFGAAVLLTGSRGPVLGILVASAVVFVFRSSTIGRWSRAVKYVVVISALVGGVALVGGGQFAVDRALAIFGGSGEGSSEVRLRLFSETVQLIVGNPLGIGWGDLPRELPPLVYSYVDGSQYTHNILLEITVEAGWIAGLAMVALLVLGLSELLRASSSFCGAVVASLAVFFVVNALVSGSVNDNRALFVTIAVGLAIRYGDMRADLIGPTAGSRAGRRGRPVSPSQPPS